MAPNSIKSKRCGRVNIANGKWTTVTCLTPMGQVRGMSKQGHKAKYFCGAIVTFSNMEDRKYKAIPEAYFKNPKPCYTKWQTHKSAKEFPASA